MSAVAPGSGHSSVRIAIVHDWLVGFAGGERVLKEILALYPRADVFTLVDFLSDEDRARLGGVRPHTSFLQHMPFARKHFRKYLPLMPRAIESFDLSAYDLIISSSHAFAKGVRVAPGQQHVSYCYTPIRYAWDLANTYFEHGGLNFPVVRHLAHAQAARLRRWDRATSDRVTQFIACSQHIAKRISAAYQRPSVVIYPPVDMDQAPLPADRDDFYLTVTRLVPYKRADMMIGAFRAMPERKLKVVGAGPAWAALAASAPPNVELLGYQPDAAVRDLMRRCRAFVFAAEEDFGISPVEAQSAGAPVVAYGVGGLAETVCGLDSATPTGVLFREQTVAALQAAILEFEENSGLIRSEACREQAQRFAPEVFRRAFSTTIESAKQRL